MITQPIVRPQHPSSNNVNWHNQGDYDQLRNLPIWFKQVLDRICSTPKLHRPSIKMQTQIAALAEKGRSGVTIQLSKVLATITTWDSTSGLCGTFAEEGLWGSGEDCTDPVSLRERASKAPDGWTHVLLNGSSMAVHLGLKSLNLDPGSAMNTKEVINALMAN